MNKSKLAISIVFASSVIAGCTGTTHSSKWEEIKESNEYQMGENFKKHKDLMTPKENTGDHVKDEFFVGYTTLDIVKRNRDNLPKVFYNLTSVHKSEKVAYDDIPELIYKDFGIVFEYVNQKTGGDANATPGLPDVEAGGQDALFPLTAEDNSEIGSLFEDPTSSSEDPTTESDENTIDYKYTGDLKGLLDYITIAMDKKWEYDNETGKVYVYKYSTETFNLLQNKETIAKNTSVSTNNSGGESAEGGGTSGTTQSINFSAELNFWDDMQKNIENMLSEDAVSSFDPTQGTVIITDSDYVLSNVRKYVKQLNIDAAKQVAVDVQILNVRLSEDSNFGVNWTAVNQTVSNSLLGSNLQGGFSFGNTSANLGNNITLNNTSTGMNALFHALNEFSTFKTENKVSAITVNNKPVPLQVTTDTSYIESLTTEDATDNNGAQTSTEIGTVKSGITMTVTPKIHDQNVILEYSMNLAVLDRLVSVGNDGVQTPIVSSKNFTQRIVARNGQPTIVAAFSRESNNLDTSSPFSGDLWFIGGSEETSKDGERIVIVVTPYIVSNE